MYLKILARMRECVRQNRLVFSIHAIEEMDADDLMKVDVENCILKGKIVARQWDDDFQQYKYLLDGETMGGEEFEIVAKLTPANTLVITAYLL